MITFFRNAANRQVYVVEHTLPFTDTDIEKLSWLMGGAQALSEKQLAGAYIGPRAEMITPWSTNAVEIVGNMNIEGVKRIEELFLAEQEEEVDKMLQRFYKNPGQDIFLTTAVPNPVIFIDNLEEYNQTEGLALSDDEIEYLYKIEKSIGRKLTDSEVFGFSQVNSEHCRHKIFNGTFILDGQEQPNTLFGMIKETSRVNPNSIVSAYKDNVAFISGPKIQQFAPQKADEPSFFEVKERNTVLSIKAETHNFPTTVEPFNGAATGTGGEIRDRMSGGKASIPIAGTAVYMTSYHRLGEKLPWKSKLSPRPWLYQTPQQILTKASNGASDFGNKFGQPLINGSLLTYEHQEAPEALSYGYDKVIMLAGGIGYAAMEDAQKGEPQPDQTVVVMGGDNYRIGMGGGAVSSVNTGQFSSGIELNAVQRANPEMQKRVQNVVRAMSESDRNFIVSIHDHGAGGHLNSLTELIETTGGDIDIDALPVGDPTLSAKEIIGNESQERIGLLVNGEDYSTIERIAQRECAPIYKVGKTTDDHRLLFSSRKDGKVIDLKVEDLLGNSPKTIITDCSVKHKFSSLHYDSTMLEHYLDQVLQLDAVACKDWLTNKVDRSVTGRVACQQCCGEIQLPLNDLGAIAIDFTGTRGMATAIGHAPQAGLIDAAIGSVLSVAEALTNIVFAPLEKGLESVSLSANWMWPCRNKGEDVRLYQAVEACADFAIALGINIPTGKDSLSMTQKYPDGTKVLSPGTVIITAAAPVSDVKAIVHPNIKRVSESYLVYIDFSFDKLRLGGSAFAQILGELGSEAPSVTDAEYFVDAFAAVQDLIKRNLVLAGHDISAGGLVTTLLEMCFANRTGGLDVTLDNLESEDVLTTLFAENPGVVLQIEDFGVAQRVLESYGVGFAVIGTPIEERKIYIQKDSFKCSLDIDEKRDVWYNNSFLLDSFQSANGCAQQRFDNYKNQPIEYKFPQEFDGRVGSLSLRSYQDTNKRSGIVAAILRNKGTNGEREMAYALHLAGFDVKDVHLSDLISGREDLKEVQMLVFCGGFSDSDVFGSAKGWAGGILYNERAKRAIDSFYKRPDTLSLGICNGCQLMAELGILYPEHTEKHKMRHNTSHKFESSFVSLEIPQNESIMLGNLSGSKLGIWVAHGEGQFVLPYEEERYNVIARYSYDAYPANPNGSPKAVAGLCSDNGRHLALMPHPERAIFPWQCAHYPYKGHEITPWMQAFRNAFQWIKEQKK